MALMDGLNMKLSEKVKLAARRTKRVRLSRPKMRTISAITLRRPFNIIAIAALSLNILAISFPALVASYNNAQARIPRPLVADQQATFPPAANTTQEGKKTIDKMPDTVNAKLGEELASFKKGATDLRHVSALDEGRTANDTIYQNADGSKSLVHTLEATNYQDESGKWQGVDPTLVEDSTNGNWHSKANSWQVSFGDISQDGIKITKSGHVFAFSPIGANSVKPVVSGNSPNQAVLYRNVWQGIDLRYRVSGSEIQETIIVKSKAASANLAFTTSGANLVSDNKVTGAYDLDGAFSGFVIPAPTVNSADHKTDNSAVVASQSYSNGTFNIGLDQSWLNSQPFSAFPIAIDPPILVGASYEDFESTGTTCTGLGCANTVGEDASGNKWRFAFHVPITVPSPPYTYLVSAQMHLELYSGNPANETIAVDHSTCQTSWTCYDNAWGESSGSVATNSSSNTPPDIDVTTVYRNAIAAGNLNPWMMVRGDESTSNTLKEFDDTKTSITLNFDTLPSGYTTDTQSPANGGISISTQPTLFTKPSSIVDPDSSSFQYRFIVGTTKNIPTSNPFNMVPSLTGLVADSGHLPINQWTVPSNVLQDGNTYFWQPVVWDNYTGAPDTYGPVYSFSVDLRNGKDKTQSIDQVGPVNVDMATGNLSTGIDTHSITALGGSIGTSLAYNSPQRSEQGIVGQYWNDPSGTHAFPTTAPLLQRVDSNADFAWNSQSPYPGLITSTNYLVRWSGYFVAPQNGTYQFGTTSNGGSRVFLNGSSTAYLDQWSALPTNVYGAGVALTAGQVVQIKYEYFQATGSSQVHLLAKTSDGTITGVVNPSWLQTGVQPITASHGLYGQYYTDDGTHTFDTTNTNNSFLKRTDTGMNFNWGTGSPVPNGPTDKYIVRWNGYFTAPVADTYTFGAGANDGVRIILSGTNTVLNSWSNHAASPIVYGLGIPLTAGQTIPIEIDYYKDSHVTDGSAAQLAIYMQQAALGTSQPDRIVDSSLLSPQANILPEGWNLGLNNAGVLSYDYAVISQGSVILYDSTGLSHDYQFVNGGFTPPVNDSGHMWRNGDGTITLQDSDGRTYVFNIDGTIKSATTSVDDLHPTALTYTYGTSGGSVIPHVTQITDPVDTSRWMKIYYSGDTTNCPSVASGFVSYSSTPGMICAFSTSDGTQASPVSLSNGNVTQLQYVLDGTTPRLSEIIKPGNDYTDFSYLPNNGTNSCPGCLSSTRNTLANDAAIAGVRAKDGTELTSVTYDALGHVLSVTMPAATAGAVRQAHTYNYYNAQTLMHVSNATEPNGFSRKILYDATQRTTDSFDVANLDSKINWDPVKDLPRSETDSAQYMITTLYDYDKRATDQYGPAPSAWFDTNPADSTYDMPLSAYTSQVPHQKTGYDENIKSLAAAYYDVDTQSNGTGTSTKLLWGSPKLHTTGVGNVNGDINQTWNATPPFTPDSGYGWGTRLTGDIHLGSVGNYTFRAYSNDGVRVWIDDTLVIDDWADGAPRSHAMTSGYLGFNNTTDSWHRIRVDYYNHVGATNATLQMFMTPPGGVETSSLGSLLTPLYSLTTSQTTSDSSASVGDRTKTNAYGVNPELGLVQSSTVDPAGLNLTTNYTYETPTGTGSYLRQLTKSLPGSATANPSETYTYYGATETRQNPCNTAQTFKQAGMIKLSTQASPANNGTGGLASETVYDDAGRTIATRQNTEAWVCNTYDARGRITQKAYPSQPTNPATGVVKPARTINYNYAVSGNPLVTNVSDSSGTVTTTSDILNRTTTYVDANGNSTTYSYDNLGRLISKVSPIGTEGFGYDNFNRMTSQQLNSVTLASPTYDAYSRLSTVTYPGAGSLGVTIGYDSLGRKNSANYTLGNGTSTIADNVTLSQSGQVISGTENGAAKSETYDKDGRLLTASIGSNSYAYTFGAPTSCTGTYNVNAGKNSNRTSMTRVDSNGNHTTTYCYDYADRLTSSADPTAYMSFLAPQYDAHWNMNFSGYSSATTYLDYDSSDRNVYIRDSNGVYNTNDAVDRPIYVRDSAQNTYYGYTGSGSNPAFMKNSGGTLMDSLIQLPGGVSYSVRPFSSPVTTYSLPNLHGDFFATTDGTGALNQTAQYEPFGNTITNYPNFGTNPPTNLSNGESLGWSGQQGILQDRQTYNQYLQLGARLYIPTLGRFAQVDPVDGGNANPFIYPQDPVNSSDLTGRCLPECLILLVPYINELLNGLSDTPGPTTTLPEQLTMKEVLSNPAIGKERMQGKIKDPSYPAAGGWQKMQYTHRPMDASKPKVTVHYFWSPILNAVKQLKIVP